MSVIIGNTGSSQVVESDPITVIPTTVSPRGLEGYPSVGGLDDTPGTHGLMSSPLARVEASNVSQLKIGALTPAEDKGRTSSSIEEKRKIALNAKHASPALNAPQTSLTTTSPNAIYPQHQKPQSQIALDALQASKKGLDCSLKAGIKSNQSGNMEILPAQQSDLDIVTDNQDLSNVAVGERAILDFTCNNGLRMQLILNSVLCYTSKCVTDKLKTSVIVKLINNFYNGSDIDQAYRLSRSLLQQNERPRRYHPSCQNEPPNIEIGLKCKQIVKMVKR